MKIFLLFYMYLSTLLQPVAFLLSLLSVDSLRLQVQRTRTEFGSRAFSVAAPTVWNALPNKLRLSSSLSTFENHLKSLLFSTAFTWQYHFSASVFSRLDGAIYILLLYYYWDLTIVTCIIHLCYKLNTNCRHLPLKHLVPCHPEFLLVFVSIRVSWARVTQWNQQVGMLDFHTVAYWKLMGCIIL